jgi:hypothetical protein
MSDSQPLVQPNNSKPPARVTYRYPAGYRVQAWLGAALFGLIMIGSGLAAVAALQHSRLNAMLPVMGVVSGLTGLLLGLDIGTRAVTTTEDGLQVKGLRAQRASALPWSDVLGWRYLPLSLIHLRLKRGPGLLVWPILERYTELLATIDERATDRVTR